MHLFILACSMSPLTEEDVQRFLESLALKDLLESSISEFWLPIGLAAVFVAAERWRARSFPNLPGLILLIWAYQAQMAHFGMWGGCTRGFEFPRQLLGSLLSLALVLLILVFSPQRASARRDTAISRLAPTVAVLTVLIDWSLVLVAVYPICSSPW
jgi:hypothetical protein